MKKSNVYFFIADKNTDILQALKNDYCALFVCCGTGNKGFKQAMKEVKPNETVYQIKQTVENIEILYTY